MRVDLQLIESKLQQKPYRLSHAGLLILLLLIVAVLALWGRSAAAQAGRIEETIVGAMALEPDVVEGASLYRQLASGHRYGVDTSVADARLR